jgi:hypothetical protein
MCLTFARVCMETGPGVSMSLNFGGIRPIRFSVNELCRHAGRTRPISIVYASAAQGVEQKMKFILIVNVHYLRAACLRAAMLRVASGVERC